MKRICQSYGMPLLDDKYFSTNADGSINTTYCFYCYNDGQFIDGCNTVEEKMNACIEIAVRSGMTKNQAEDLAKSVLPSLDRWKA